MNRSFNLFAVILMTVLLVFTSTHQAQAIEKKFRIAVIPKLVGTPYYNATKAGALQAGKDLNVEVVYIGPAKADATEQAKMIENLVNTGINAIAIAPNDPLELEPVLKKAKAKGVLILDWDTPLNPELVTYSIRQVDDQVYGKHLWDLLVKQMGTNQGEYAIITSYPSTINFKQWMEQGLVYAKTNYPKLKLVGVVGGKKSVDGKQQLAYQKSLEFFKAYPKLKGIIGIGTPALLGAAEAVREKRLQKRVAIIGATLPSDAKTYFSDDSLRVATLWDPVKLGYLTVFVAKTALDGKTIANGLHVPKIGKIELKDDNKTIILGQPLDFTKENAGKYKF